MSGEFVETSQTAPVTVNCDTSRSRPGTSCESVSSESQSFMLSRFPGKIDENGRGLNTG
jgi:hypothetical protein